MVEPRRTGMSMSSSGSHATPRWREVDSNFRFRTRGAMAWPSSVASWAFFSARNCSALRARSGLTLAFNVSHFCEDKRVRRYGKPRALRACTEASAALPAAVGASTIARSPLSGSYNAKTFRNRRDRCRPCWNPVSCARAPAWRLAGGTTSDPILEVEHPVARL